MRTTVDIPDPLFRRAKAEAAMRGKTLRSLVVEALEGRLGSAGEDERPGARVDLPLVPSTRPGSLRITGETVARALEDEDVDASS